MKKKRFARVLGITVLIFVVVFSLSIAYVYKMFLSKNVLIKDNESIVIFIPTGSNFDAILNIFEEKNILISNKSFVQTAKHKGYCGSVKSGRYRIPNNISNNQLVNILMSGQQEAVNLVFNNIRLVEDLCKKIATQLEFSADSLCELLQNEAVANKYGFTIESFRTMFLPNTYQMFWNISPEQFIEKMYNEYNTFWNKDRVEKAENIGLSLAEVSILASIVEGETTKKDEMATIAGVYINRLNRGMLLQADPTVVYALQDFNIKRVLTKHLEIDSHYNTYKYLGLPPGPIRYPEPNTIDAVLNYQKHDFIFMCAKADFSGYHAFAKNAREHGINAENYRKALNKKKVR